MTTLFFDTHSLQTGARNPARAGRVSWRCGSRRLPLQRCSCSPAD